MRRSALVVLTAPLSLLRKGTGFYSLCLNRRPVITKCVTAACILCTGDYVAQRTQSRAGSFRWDVPHSLYMAFYGGVAVAPISHYWFAFLAKRFPLASLKGRSAINLDTLKMVIIDQVTMLPFFVVVFLHYAALIGRPHQGVARDTVQFRERARENYKRLTKTVLLGWTIWFPGQVINFSFIPLPFRVLYVNSISFCWNTILCLQAAATSSGGNPSPSSSSPSSSSTHTELPTATKQPPVA